MSLKKIAPSGKVTISGRDEALENIKAYYEDDTGTIILPAHQEGIRKRWESIHGLILQGKGVNAIKLTISKLFDCEISESTIRRDIKCVEQIFNDQNLSFALRRQRATNLALKIYQKASKDEDWSNANKALANLIKADGLEHEPLDTPKVEPHVYVIMLDPNTQAMLDNVFPLKDGNINLNNIQDIQDTEHEELSSDST